MKKTYILTGGTGFLGGLLANKILNDGHSIIFIGKSKKETSFTDRIQTQFSSFNIDQIHTIEANLETVTSDILYTSILAFGKKIDGIWHLAANLSFKSEDKDQVFKANTEGMSRIIELSKKLQCILFHTSTAYIHGKNNGVAKEEFYSKPTEFNNSYEESKYDAEQLIKNSSNLNYIIFRPSILFDAQAEHISNFGYYSFLIALYKFKKSIGIAKKIYIPIPFFYYKESHLNLMPVDLALDWMYAISNNNKAIGKIFHITNPKPFIVGQIFEQTFKAFNVKMPIFATPLSVAMMYFYVFHTFGTIIKPLRPIAQRIYFFKGYLLKHMYYDMTNTLSFLPSDTQDKFNYEQNFISELATKVIIKLESYKKK